MTPPHPEREALLANKLRNPWKGEKRFGPHGVLTCVGATDDRRYVIVRYKGAAPGVYSRADWMGFDLTVFP